MQKKFELKVTTFEEGWAALNALEEVKQLFKDIEPTIDTVNAKMLELFTNHVPSIETGKGNSWSLNIQTTRSCLKTSRNLSIAWRITNVEYSKVKGERNTVKELIFSVLLYNSENLKYQERALIEAGFTEDETYVSSK